LKGVKCEAKDKFSADREKELQQFNHDVYNLIEDHVSSKYIKK
jgi:hypothetical protein